MAKRIVVLGTGGTISGRAERADDGVGYVAGQVGVADLLGGASLPVGVLLQTVQVAQMDSSDMDFHTWGELHAAVVSAMQDPDVLGVVITHGTDTLEETALFLARTVAAPKPVVFTCAMRPATALSADGPRNLSDALAVAASPGAQGVVAVCAGVVHGAVSVYKSHPYRIDAFSSGDDGPLAYVEEGRVRSVRPWPDADVCWSQGPPAANEWPWVEVVHSHAGADPRSVDALVQAGVRGLVVAATGNGTVHQALLAALDRAARSGVTVWRTSRCLGTWVVQPQGAAWRAAPSFTPDKARVDLMLTLLGRASARSDATQS